MILERKELHGTRPLKKQYENEKYHSIYQNCKVPQFNTLFSCTTFIIKGNTSPYVHLNSARIIDILVSKPCALMGHTPSVCVLYTIKECKKSRTYFSLYAKVLLHIHFNASSHELKKKASNQLF